jgi:methionyl-tRNA formyltransferase
MKIIFMGSPSFAIPTFERLLRSSYSIVAVFTQKPKPKNRGMNVEPSPIHALAEKNQIPVFTPESLRNDQIHETISIIEADVIIVVAYGKIIPQNIIDLKKYGCINLHPSKLPRFRGAAPLQRTIMEGDTETRICTMQMDQGLDTGDVLLYEDIKLSNRITFEQLHDLTAQIGADLIIKTLDNIDQIKPIKQSEEGLVYAHKLQKEEGLINWNVDSSFEIDCKVRAISQWPGVFFKYKEEMIKILETSYQDESHNFEPGTIIDDNLSIACAQGIIRPSILQKPGKKPISARDFINSFQIKRGDSLSR